MNKEDYLKIAKEKYKNTFFKVNKSRKLLLEQIDNYYKAYSEFKLEKNKYIVNDDVYLKKGTLLHGTNIDGLKKIVENGLIASSFTNSRKTKFPSCVSVWNLKENISLKDYMIKYSGATIKITSQNGKSITKIIPYGQIDATIENLKNEDFWIWNCEQTKEIRFMPNLAHNNLSIGIIFNSNNKYIEKLKKGDIFDAKIDDILVKPFVNEKYYKQFIKDRLNKDDFFTDRESTILFGIPSNFIEGIIVNRIYENDKNILKEIKQILPKCYICNIDGKVIDV